MVLGSDIVVEARRRAGLTQRELALRAGATQSAIARLESGRTRSSFDQVARLVRLCGFQLDLHLEPFDGSDLSQANRLAEMDPQERLNHLVGIVRTLRRLRAEAGVAG